MLGISIESQSVLCWRIYSEKFFSPSLNRNRRNENNQIMSMSPRKSRNSRVYISIKYHPHTHWIGSHKSSTLKSPAIIYVRITNKNHKKPRWYRKFSIKVMIGMRCGFAPRIFFDCNHVFNRVFSYSVFRDGAKIAAIAQMAHSFGERKNEHR